MSQNPYQSAPGLPKSSLPKSGESLGQQKPMGLTVVPVICLVLGALGALVALLALVMLFFQDFVNGLQGMQTDPGMAEYQAKMQEFHRAQFVPFLIANGSNLIVGSLLVLGAIGVFGLKEWGRNLLRNTFLLAVIVVALRGGFMIWVQYRSMEIMKETTAGQAGAAETIAMAMQVGFVIGAVIGLVWAVALIGFYLWSRAYLNKESVIALFNAAN